MIVDVTRHQGEKIASLLVFLFPIAGNTVRHWTSALFWVLVLLALYVRPWKFTFLRREEKLVIGIFVGIFASIITSSFLNGWGYLQTKGLDVQLRYLGVIPLYFLFRHNPHYWQWLVRGTAVGAVVLLGQVSYDLFILDHDKAFGRYDSQGLLAIQALTFLLVLLFSLGKRDSGTLPRPVIAAAALSALIALMLSGSRSTYVTALLLMFVSPFVLGSPKRGFLALSIAAAIAATFYYASNHFRGHVESSVVEIRNYITSQDRLNATDGSSVHQRLEMWRTALLIFKDNPVFGVGWRNFQKSAQPYIEAGKANSLSGIHPHPHSTYFEFLVSEGLIGFGLLLALFAYPFYVAHQHRDLKTTGEHLLKLFIVVYALNSLTEGGTFIYGNAMAFYFLYFIAIFAFLMHQADSINPRRQNHSSADFVRS